MKWSWLAAALLAAVAGAGDGPARAQTPAGEARAPRVARVQQVDAGGRRGEAAAYPPCLTGAFDPPGALYCPVTDADVRAGYLMQGGFEVVWIDGACEEPGAELAEFLTAVPGVRAGGHVVCTGDGAGVTRRRFDGDEANGLVVALPRGVDRATLIEELMRLPEETVPQGEAGEVVELARSAPVVATVGDRTLHVQGTFELRERAPGDDAFPRTRGHLYAFDAARVPPVAVAFGELGAPVFDAADGIPTPSLDGCDAWFGGRCRTVFANAEAGARPEVTFVTAKTAPALGLSAALVERVLQARLGGVDRSTPAVIESSPRAGEPRPTIIYVGALDGMLHAVCADGGGACRPGQELWAFLPRAQLASVRRNAQRIDGSPKVADVFGDFDGDGAREWRTVLAFQTGGGEPAVYALDVTDPFAPELLWDVPTEGAGLGVAIGPVRGGTSSRSLVFAQTAAAGGGFAVTAIEVATGDVAWSVARPYPAPRDEGAGRVPATAIPGGVSAVDLDGVGVHTHLVVPTPYGDVWLLEAATGDSVYGEAPLFRFGADHRPIGAPATLYVERDSRQLRAVIASGGYADPVATGWSPAEAEQYVVAVPLTVPRDAVPLDESSERLAFVAELGRGRRAYAQPTVAGNELFVVTDGGDVNLDTYGADGASGELTRYDLDDGGAIGLPVTLPGGASPVDVTSDGVVHAGSATAARRVDVSGTFDPEGITTELVFKAQTGRQVWLKLR